MSIGKGPFSNLPGGKDAENTSDEDREMNLLRYQFEESFQPTGLDDLLKDHLKTIFESATQAESEILQEVLKLRGYLVICPKNIPNLTDEEYDHLRRILQVEKIRRDSLDL